MKQECGVAEFSSGSAGHFSGAYEIIQIAATMIDQGGYGSSLERRKISEASLELLEGYLFACFCGPLRVDEIMKRQNFKPEWHRAVFIVIRNRNVGRRNEELIIDERK